MNKLEQLALIMLLVLALIICVGRDLKLFPL